MEKLRAACYVRTSTDREDQEGSYALQRDYFIQLITSAPGLEFAGCYGDYGKSGRFAEKRPAFRRMLQDCESGKIQIIYTKSVSRFARSIADLVETVQFLRKLGVTVIFERENLNSADRGTELLLHILGIVAQEESRSFGENVRLGREIRNASGHPVGRPPYGYRRVNADAEWSVAEPEARRVRTAFRMAASLATGSEIRAALNRLEEEEGTGLVWTSARLSRLLRHVAYIGDVETGLHYTVNGRLRPNTGQRPAFYLQGHHEPLVTPELFRRVRTLLGLRGCSRAPTGRWLAGLSPEQRAFCLDTAWTAAQNRLEQAGTVLKGVPENDPAAR